jgi:hypothetical protein
VETTLSIFSIQGHARKNCQSNADQEFSGSTLGPTENETTEPFPIDPFARFLGGVGEAVEKHE